MPMEFVKHQNEIKVDNPIDLISTWERSSESIPCGEKRIAEECRNVCKNCRFAAD